MITQVSKLIILLLLFAARTAFAGDTVLGGSCDLAVVGASDKQNFLVFHRELRAALSRQDVAATALLVKFPLRLNHGDGSTISLGNPAALQTRFAEAFPPTVRSVVIRQKPEALFCKHTGIMYGKGEVWIGVAGQDKMHRYRVTVVNLSLANQEAVTTKVGKLAFVCDAEKHRVVIDSGAGGKVRYRAWNKPRSVLGAPDMEISSGTWGGAGTDPCSHSIWTFSKGDTTFTVSELGCTDSSVPADVTGELQVSVAGERQNRWWCY